MIENLLDKNGRGSLTVELDKLFTVSGCRPKCHVCNKNLKVNQSFRLKPFATEKTDSETKKSLSIMVCGDCDKQNKKLPYHELYEALKSLGIEIPEWGDSSGKEKEKLRWIWDEMKAYYKKWGFKQYRMGGGMEWLSTWDELYFEECEQFEKGIKKLNKRFEVFFEFEDFKNDATSRAAKAHADYVKSLPKKGGCFVLTSGKTETIIAGK